MTVSWSRKSRCPAKQDFIRHAVKAKVQGNYHITIVEDWHNYSVPLSFIGKTVNAIYNTDSVEIYHGHKGIALHVRSSSAMTLLPSMTV